MIDKTDKIIVPKNKRQERELKTGFIDDNNENIAYFKFGLFWPNVVLYILSVLLVLWGIRLSIKYDYVPTDEQLETGYRKMYGAFGKAFINCTENHTALPEEGLPSVINLFETNAVGNILFRFAVCLPIAVRFFSSLVFRMKFAQHGNNFVHEFINNITPALTLLEVFSLAFFAIVTSHTDSEDINSFSKKIFAASSAANMAMTTVVFFANSTSWEKNPDFLSAIIKVICMLIYCYVVPQVSLDPSRDDPFICHSIVSRLSAIKEYVAIFIYALFHSTTLIDIRNLTFVCYPRSCSGECEPVDPENFAKGGKYEHCRSWEHNQRLQILNKTIG